jgi:signal transduction histidine kinase
MTTLARRWRVVAPPRKLSVRLRLSLLYSLVLAITLLSFTFVLSSAMSSLMYGMVEHSVRDAARQLLNNNDPRIDRAIFPATRFAAPETFVQFRTLNGTVTTKTDNLGDRQLPLDDDALAAVRRGQDRVETITIDDSRLLVLTTRIPAQGRPAGILQVARSLAEVEETASVIHWISLAGAAVAVLVAFGLGWILAGAALSPMAAIAETARRIGKSRDFQQRLSQAGDGDEIGRLAGALNEMLAALGIAYAQAEQGLQAQRRLVADASHELRTPLTTIRGNLGLLQRTPPIDDADREAVLDDIAGETERLIRLVNDLLVLTRTDAGTALELSTVELRPLVLEVGRRAAATWPQHAIAADSGDFRVRANRDALVQILLILLDNAAKFTPPGGRITVWTAAGEDGIRLHVRDNGSGISPEQLPHIFDRFYRGDTVRSGNGAGLGLAIARSLLTGQGGTINVTSTPGAGTTFTITLPRA